MAAARSWTAAGSAGTTPIIARAPVISVDSISYTDTSGQPQTLDPSAYQVDTLSEPGRIAPAYGTFWPGTQPGLNAVQIQFTIGYTVVPPTFLHAIKLIAASWYENREDVTVGAGNAQTLPRAAEAILAPYRILSFGYPEER